MILASSAQATFRRLRAEISPCCSTPKFGKTAATRSSHWHPDDANGATASQHSGEAVTAASAWSCCSRVIGSVLPRLYVSSMVALSASQASRKVLPAGMQAGPSISCEETTESRPVLCKHKGKRGKR